MAGDWIKMRVDLWDHPKVVRIVSAICPQGVRDTSLKCRVIGALYQTWSLADRHTEDGRLDGYTAEALNFAVGIEGWAEAMQHVGWLAIETQSLIVPRFEEHNGDSAKRRAEDAKRKKRVRKMSATERTKCGPEKRRGEKRREDSNTSPPPADESAAADSKSRATKFDERHSRFASQFWDRVHDLQPGRKPPDLDRWANDVRLMEYADGRDLNRAWEVAKAALADSFWCKNVLSPATLRAKYDDLELKLLLPTPSRLPLLSRPLPSKHEVGVN